MTEEMAIRQRKRKRLWLALAALLLLVAFLVVPPLVSVNRYKSQITLLMSASLGHPVRLSSVGVRILPWPSFVLTDLTVEEDPAYGAEPILHANAVTASIRLLSLWRGRLEIDSVSVDEASLNLVRTGTGRWNLDSLFRTVTVPKAKPDQATETAPKLPSIEATDSRINIKDGVEKLPFSFLSTDLKFWEESPGEWRLRLTAQPARTDVALNLADTGAVRLEARGTRAPQLSQMPLHLDIEWREAQLGQLSRLLIGSDPGWRGNLTGELHLDGNAEAAEIKARLRAEGVHRAEFAPAEPMDFDANCALLYHYSARAVENLACDSPLGNGRFHLFGDLSGEGAPPHLAVEFNRIPLQFGLDALRTIRSGFGTGLEARGTLSGKITFTENVAPEDKPRPAKNRSEKAHPAAGPLSGSLTVEGLQISGDPLSAPIRLPRFVLEPVAAAQGQSQALATTVAIPSGAGLLTVTARLALSGYQISVRGQAAIARARELAKVCGMRDAPALDSLSGGSMTVDLSTDGPWIPVPGTAYSNIPVAALPAPQIPLTRRVTGTLVLRNAHWNADFLANPVQISQATLHLGQGEIRWDPAAFSYGPVKGTASLALPDDCVAPLTCLPHFQIQFDDLDAEALQAAVLGAHERGTLLSTLLARLRPSSAPSWPRTEGQITAGSLVLGPVTLHDATAALRTTDTGVVLSSLDAALLGGRLHASGTFEAGEVPAYNFKAELEKLSPAAVGQLLGWRSTGTKFDADGKIELSGFTAHDLAASAKGSLHFDWRHGSIAPAPASDPIPAALTRFERWTGDAAIANGAVTIKQNLVQRGPRKHTVEATVTFTNPPKVVFPKQATPAPRQPFPPKHIR